MAITNQERVAKALELVRAGLGPFLEREVAHAVNAGRAPAVVQTLAADPMVRSKPISQWGVDLQLRLMWDGWNDIFRQTLGPAERGLVGELRGHRNRWAHQDPFSGDDTDRALDSGQRLLTAVSAPEADELGKMKMELRRLIFEEQSRGERRRSAGSTVESAATGTLKPWREVVNPHPDVASGRYQQAEFAADLWQVAIGEGSDEYRKPVEFFRRTYLTQSLRDLLAGAMRRLTGVGGDPVVQLQTNFGGGKTHSMLALYHLFGGGPPTELLGVDALLATAGVSRLPEGVRRVVLVGNKISPGNPSTKADGTVVRTLWGELAWQLGGREAYDRIRADDERATSPGDALRELMNAYGPCLILVDEWVAYARQLHDESDLPGGSFETHFSFAQALTESAKLADAALLVISLPASDTGGSAGEDEEVGGARGRAALARLRNVIGRVESSWAPASTEEGFEIVRRRLFEPLIERTQFTARDGVARAFADLYAGKAGEFPSDCRESGYEDRIRTAYPIHPEVFDRLYTDWSTLVRFQRTRGVLRLMAAVIHSLWEKGDRNPLIMPANIPIDDLRVRDELTRYLSDQWKPIIEKDVDGPNALPLRLDGEVPNLGKFAATRRVARAIYLGSAPTAFASNRGVEDRRIKLGCVMPGEPPEVFGDALRRLSSAATFLYQDGNRYWYSTQPTVTKLAEELAEQLKREADKVAEEIETRLRADVRAGAAEFSARVHAFPQSGADVPDAMEARLLVLGIDHPYSKEPSNLAEAAATAILQNRGSAPRLFQNTLVFLAADRTRLQDLEEAVRRYLAWRDVVARKEELNLDEHQRRQAETQVRAAEGAVAARLPETYQWLLAPEQKMPSDAIAWKALRLTAGQDPIAARAAKRLRNEELLVPILAGTRLRMELDRVPLWRGDHVSMRQLADDFARYIYLPRLTDPSVLAASAMDGLGVLLWERESFAYADSYDQAKGRFVGLRAGDRLSSLPNAAIGLLVHPQAAVQQLRAEQAAGATISEGNQEPETGHETEGVGVGPAEDPRSSKPSRFYGTVVLDPSRVGRDAGRIAEEVLAHLGGLKDAEVTVTLDIQASIPGGVADGIVRTVTENSRTLRFTSYGFERD